MIDITKARATTVEHAAFGHLLLCWIDGACYRSIRVSGGLLCFHAPARPSGGVEAAVRYLEEASMVCLDVGSAVVRWCDDNVAQGRAGAGIGDVIVDENGIAILGRDTDPAAFAQGAARRAWRVADGEPENLSSLSLVIRNWEIGVRGESGEFVKFQSFPRMS